MYKCKYQNQVGEFISNLQETNKKFDKIFIESLDIGLIRVLGEACTQATYQLLKERFGLSKPQIPHAVDKFTSAVEELFGQAARLLEISIIEYIAKNVATSFVFTPKTNDFSFSEYIKTLKVYLTRVPLPLLAS